MNGPLPTKRISDTEREIRAIIVDVLLNAGQAYSAQFWMAWALCGGIQKKKSGMAKIQKILRSMQDDGLIVGRIVPFEEHRGSQYARRYYRLVGAKENENV